MKVFSKLSCLWHSFHSAVHHGAILLTATTINHTSFAVSSCYKFIHRKLLQQQLFMNITCYFCPVERSFGSTSVLCAAQVQAEKKTQQQQLQHVFIVIQNRDHFLFVIIWCAGFVTTNRFPNIIPCAQLFLWKNATCLFVITRKFFLLILQRPLVRGQCDLLQWAMVSFVGCVCFKGSFALCAPLVWCRCGSPQGRVAPHDWCSWQEI